MNNKDLFDALHNVDEDYITSAWNDTDAARPIVLRPENRSVKKTVRNIMLGVGGTAAAAAVGFAVIAGTNGFTLKQIETSTSGAGTSDFDPNAPLPIEIVAPDGNLLTYNDLVNASINGRYYFWETGETAEKIAQMDDLFENFFDIISKTENVGGGFWNTGYVYLPEPGSDKLKRYNTGDMYCGLKIVSCSSSFDENCKYFNGNVHFESSDKLTDVEVTRIDEYDFQKSYPSTNDVSDNYHFGGHNCYGFTSNDPKLTALTSGLNDEFIKGKILISTDIPLNIPIKTTIDCLCLNYCANEDCYCNSDEPAITFFAVMRGFEPYDGSLKQWTEKGLVLPSKCVSDDFNFLSNDNIVDKLGCDIFAVDDGEVVEANDYTVVIKHGEGLYTMYSYMKALAHKGDTVKAGDVIGVSAYGGPDYPEVDYTFTREKPELMPIDNEYFKTLPGSYQSQWAKKQLVLPTDFAQDDFDFLGENTIVADYNSEVYAVDSGEVVYASTGKYNDGYGNVVCIKHGEEIFTTYTNLSDEDGVLVQKGDKVEAGQLIGRVGNSCGNELDAPHIHYVFSIGIFNGEKD